MQWGAGGHIGATFFWRFGECQPPKDSNTGSEGLSSICRQDGPAGCCRGKLFAVVQSPWALCATASPAYSVPLSVPGGNPVIEAASQTPISPVTSVGPLLATAGVAGRIPNVQAVHCCGTQRR